ncbi:NUDIX hydrolase [Agrobacterium albertimagni AOL15]|uniref:NUDIX hydrolase n=1 Tax=Agrobacterium albertimagni AOL15 TaxID=1156935 RepID=K2QR14_9HYPH|nr:hypothetical protein [Agrobacterium albertimagni]EKF57397.1 NUDIX hydrolase [Agrobacterium albertimagni AOL15]
MKKEHIVDQIKDEGKSIIIDQVKGFVREGISQILIGSGLSLTLKSLGAMVLGSSEHPPFLIKKRRSRFLIEDPDFAVQQYSAEKPISPHIPYVELANFSKLLAKGKKPTIELQIKRDKFQLRRWENEETDWLVDSALGALKQENRVTRDSAVVRVSEVRPTKEGCILVIQEARYKDQAMSNLILDFDELPNGQKSDATIRAQLLKEYGSKLPPLHDDRLVNSLGCAVLVFYELEGKLVPLQVMRSVDTAVFNGGGWHCTASGAAEWPKDPGSTEDSFQAYIEDDIYRELRDEVGFPPGSVKLELVGICRELMRGGKPQLFFIGFSEQAPEKIAKQMEAARLEQIRARNEVKFAEPVEVLRHPYLHEARSFKDKDHLEASALKLGFTAEATACLYYFFDMMNAAEHEFERRQM